MESIVQSCLDARVDERLSRMTPDTCRNWKKKMLFLGTKSIFLAAAAVAAAAVVAAAAAAAAWDLLLLEAAAAAAAAAPSFSFFLSSEPL